MTHSHRQDGSIVLHRSRAYDLVFGRLIRRSDGPILVRAGVGPGDRVLDVGTGPGYLALAASRLVGPQGDAVGIDASREMVEQARRRAAAAGSSARYEVASAAALPFEDGSFDVVVSRLVLHHLAGDVKTRALDEVFRVLKPSGRLVIADLASPAVQRGHHLTAHVLRRQPKPDEAVERIVWDAGLREVTYGPLLRGLLTGVAAVKPHG